MPEYLSPALYIDFARLGPPEVIEEIDKEELIQFYRDEVVAKNPDLARAVQLEQSGTNIILEAQAAGEMIVRARVNAAARAVMLAFASGADLDHIAARFSVRRLTYGDPPVSESDERLRHRIQIALESFTTAGSSGAYVYHALTAEPTLRNASALKVKPGHVKVSLMADGVNPVPTAEQIAKVKDRLTSPQIKPLTDMVTVAAAQKIDAAIVANVALYPGPDASLVVADISKALDRLRSRIALIGRDLTRSQIITAISQEGVHSVDLVSPPADVIVRGDQFVWITEAKINLLRDRKE